MDGELLDAIDRFVAEERLGALATVITGPHAGESALIASDGTVVGGALPEDLGGEVVGDAVELMAVEQARTLTYGDSDVFVETLAPQPRLVVWGADEVAISLGSMARQAGFRVIVCDPRPAFAVAERFPDADEVLTGWPADLEDQVLLDGRTYVVVLTHDTRVEGPLLPLVLGSEARYIGTLGSRRTHAKRVERLHGEGWGEADTDRIHGPVGLDIGAERPAEIAVSILAEMIQARYRSGSGLSLRGREGRIHRQRPEEPEVG
jgi:xanthine dehydrogenase accessory factor